MSVASDLIAALSETGLPCAQGTYTGAASAYLVFTFSVLPTAYSDDEARCERYLIQLSLFAPFRTNTTALEGTIKRLLSEAGYPRPSVLDASEDDRTRHLVFETETVVAVDG